jgi:uncharacterized membrane protein
LRRTGERRAIAALAALVAGAYTLFGVLQHRRFGTSIDLAIFDQAIWHLSRSEAPASTVSGLSNIFGDHFSPILVLLAPLYWVAPRPETLIACQALLLAASIVPVFLFLRRRLPLPHALGLSAAYALFWCMQRTMKNDFHEMAFAPLLVAIAVLALDRRRWGWLWTACVLLVLVKEDLIPLITIIGLYLLADGERLHGALLTASSLVAFVLIVAIVIPRFNDSGEFRYAGGYADILAKPWLLPIVLLTPAAKIRTLVSWFASFAFLPAWSPLVVLLVPLALERFLSSNSAHWGTTFHHSAPIAPIMAMSAGDGLARIVRGLSEARARRRLGVLTALSVLLSSLLPSAQPLWLLLKPSYYAATASERAGYRALAVVPADAAVVAQAALLPHLSHRNTLYTLTPAAPDADFIVAAADLTPWPLPTRMDLLALVADRRTRGYEIAFEDAGWIVLRRGRPSQSINSVHPEISLRGSSGRRPVLQPPRRHFALWASVCEERDGERTDRARCRAAGSRDGAGGAQ